MLRSIALQLAGRIALEIVSFGAAAATTVQAGSLAIDALIGEAAAAHPTGRAHGARAPGAPMDAGARGLLDGPPRGAPIAWTPDGLFLGMSDDALLERLRRIDVRRVKINTGGSSLNLKLTFADGSAAAFKPQQVWTSAMPRKEIAAFRIDRALGLGAVPPAVTRVLAPGEVWAKLDPKSRPLAGRIRAEASFRPDGSLAGEASYWIPTIADLRLEGRSWNEWTRWMRAGEWIPDGSEWMAAQISSMIVFDYLINNVDRFSGANTLADERLERLFYMDNSMGFDAAPDGHPKCLQNLDLLERFSRRLVAALERMNVVRLRAALAAEIGAPPARSSSWSEDPPFPILLDEEVAGVMARRDRVLARVADLRGRLGDGAVLAFP
ncbi:MAG: hypothetical protein AABZ30_08760 [Myxococcota bacterium]